jgi:hypothetical protein
MNPRAIEEIRWIESSQIGEYGFCMNFNERPFGNIPDL